MMKIGLDVGSTTLKAVVLDHTDAVIYQKYERHYSKISEKAAALLQEIAALPGIETPTLSISGSAGMGLAEGIGLPFVQEVYATRISAKKLCPETETVIELGGEDAKILFLKGAMEVRMNGSCAGGTGAFIDQMATLLNVTPAEMNTLAGESTKTYSIASRCGVFAKSDIQALLNQGARKEDIAAAIFSAVVNQTIAGLAQGRPIEGNVLYLGGPLTFLPQLRSVFDHTLGLQGLCPENSLYFVAIGAALSPGGVPVDLSALTEKIRTYSAKGGYKSCAPLFSSEAEYHAFEARHSGCTLRASSTLPEDKTCYLGIDAGSTTLKAAVINRDGDILFSRYLPNNGNPVPLVRQFLIDLYEAYPEIQIAGAASTGYGEELIKNAFQLDFGVVETIAHFTAAKKFDPQVDFIIDIGGQDIKCFKIKNGAIDNVFLNEACSSGCGSFLQTFAGAMGYSIAEFAKLGLQGDRPVDLGSRCTVFMNSSVKQAQKDGASIENISAGLSISVVKNALYKVIRVAHADSLGSHIVVQGGTFLNDAVLRAFEQEIGKQVIRPAVAGLMGAYGAALYAKSRSAGKSTVLSRDALENFTHKSVNTTCNGCSNHCKLTINTFAGGGRYIAGNRCEKPVAKGASREAFNLYAYKRELLSQYSTVKGEGPTIGLPMGLNLYELYPFWHTFFRTLGFGVTTTGDSTRTLYFEGQHTIPSDTVCYPAKLLHGHVEALLRDPEVDVIFYPCMSYNFNEKHGDNHYNCPVVAYYPEVIHANIPQLEKKTFISDYVGPHRRHDFPRKMHAILKRHGLEVPLLEVTAAADAAYQEYSAYMEKIRKKGEDFLAIAKEQDLPVIILAGRPYHLDPEVNHGIDKLICDCGAVLVTEDSVSHLTPKFRTHVLNQWTYHARLYSAAKYAADRPQENINLVQLVSFGCGVDAITGDEVRSIIEAGGKIYTQIKIDEITNLGAVKIRLRSLFAALEQAKEAHG